ncbi:MAG: DegV family protein [Anaerolineae bacterium]|nr:DegV family protein [Anaerolineae bacterium]
MSMHSSDSDQPLIIVTDIACDLPAQILEQYHIRTMPLKVLFGDEVYLSGVDMTPAQFYARLAQGDVHPTTSQPTVADFRTLYQELGAAGVPILSIHLSEGLSGTVNVARMAAQELPDLPITVWDSGTLTSAMGMQVLTAARAAQAGYAVEDILPLLEQTHRAADLLFIVDDLMYLHRGGRIGTVSYHVGQVLHIKPIITVCKTGDLAGTYVPAGRVRSMSKAIPAFIEHVAKAVGEDNKLRAISLYGDDPALAQQLNAQLAKRFDCVYLDMVPTAPALGVHVGPSALGIGFAVGDWPV